MGIYYMAKRSYQMIGSPMSKTLFGGTSTLSRVILWLKGGLEKTANHDEIYDRAYYEKYSSAFEPYAERIAQELVRRENPKTCIDVGCGSGEILSALRKLGVKSKGFDNSIAALDMCREKGLDVEHLDLEGDPTPSERADVVISTEVAEHIPASFADAYARYLSKCSDIVYVTAAPPGQGGTDHVNEQPREYWIDKFAAHGMKYDAAENDAIRAEWEAADVDLFRRKNLLVFRR